MRSSRGWSGLICKRRLGFHCSSECSRGVAKAQANSPGPAQLRLPLPAPGPSTPWKLLGLRREAHFEKSPAVGVGLSLRALRLSAAEPAGAAALGSRFDYLLQSGRCGITAIAHCITRSHTACLGKAGGSAWSAPH